MIDISLRARQTAPGRLPVRSLTFAVMMMLLTPVACLAQGVEPLGFSKGDPNIVRAQIELSVSYLRIALSTLDASTAPEELEAASQQAYAAYRMMRFSIEGLAALSNKRYANPIYEIVGATVNDARFLIIHARLALDAAAKWPENGQPQLTDAVAKLRHALDLAERAQLLI